MLGCYRRTQALRLMGAMHLTAINSAEAVFEPFFDPHLPARGKPAEAQAPNRAPIKPNA